MPVQGTYNPKSDADLWNNVRAQIRRGASDDYQSYRYRLATVCPNHITRHEFQEMCADYVLFRTRP